MKQKDLPAFCRVEGILRPAADSEIRYEVWLPEHWNGKLQGIGNGGFAGSISYGGLADAVRHGYAVVATDTGHQGKSATDSEWALGHAEKVVDFGHRAIHEVTVKAKEVVRQRYGSGPKRSYFNSCSNGGRQALMEAQRYPEDYDGIIAGAPAYPFTSLIATGALFNKAAAEPGAYFPASKLKAIEAVSLEACDGRDGVRDGVIENPPTCKPDYTKLLCQGVENDQCLTVPQLKLLQTIYAGSPALPALTFGTEAGRGGWEDWITGKKPETAAVFEFGTGFFRNMMYGRDWDYRSFDPDKDGKAAREKWGNTLDATDPDLSRFQRRGGKLILYHGWSDAAIPARSTLNYFEAVQARMGHKKAAEFVRLYMVPGMQHCGGGPGAVAFGQGGVAKETPRTNLSAALEAWVEQGTAPEQIVAKGTNGKTRPLCVWPQVAQYKGTGSTDDATNFSCAVPR